MHIQLYTYLCVLHFSDTNGSILYTLLCILLRFHLIIHTCTHIQHIAIHINIWNISLENRWVMIVDEWQRLNMLWLLKCWPIYLRCTLFFFLNKLILKKVKTIQVKWVLRKCILWTELLPPKLICWHPNPPVPQDLTIFANRVFKDMIKLKFGH